MGAYGKFNTGIIDKIYGVKVKGGTALGHIKKVDQMEYHTNIHFIANLAVLWNLYYLDYDPTTGCARRFITPEILAQNLEHYGIRTNKGDKYVYGSRGPFNLVRAAWRTYDGLVKAIEELAQQGYHTARIIQSVEEKNSDIATDIASQDLCNRYKHIRECIERVYVNANEEYAY